MGEEIDLHDPDAPYRPVTVSAGRRAWLVFRVYASLLLGLGISIFSFTRQSLLGILLGGLVIFVSVILAFSKGAGFRRRGGLGES